MSNSNLISELRWVRHNLLDMLSDKILVKDRATIQALKICIDKIEYVIIGLELEKK